MNISSWRSSEEGGILGAWYYTRQVGRRWPWRGVVQSPGDSKEDSGEGDPWFLVLYQEEWAAVIQADGDPIPGNSQRCDARHKFPRRRRRWSLGPGVIPGGMGQWWSKRMATQFQEIPSGVTLGTNFPEGGDGLVYTSSSRRRWCDWQSVIYTRVAWATAIT